MVVRMGRGSPPDILKVADGKVLLFLSACMEEDLSRPKRVAVGIYLPVAAGVDGLSGDSGLFWAVMVSFEYLWSLEEMTRSSGVSG